MSAWTAKRFWKQATASACEGGFTVTLDGRAVKTPAKSLLVVPTLAMAEAIALEWDAQDGVIKPDTMPVTRAANSALDKVAPQFAEVAALLAAYGETDLLCYRATGPQELIDRQAAGWDPLLDWAAQTYGAPLLVTAGVVHITQPEPSVRALWAAVHGFDNFRLAALHDLIAITGSLVLALAVTARRLTAAEAWDLSRIDETWQNELWGVDDEAAELEAFKREALLAAERFFGLCG
jgi:chaperone required for assembly of F1-ATPase